MLTKRQSMEFSDQQILFFFTPIFVIALVDLLCLFKLAQTSWFERSSSSGGTRLTVCEEISIYFTFLSTTLGFILPPPESNNLAKGPKDISDQNGQEPSTHLQESEEREEEVQEEFKTTRTEDDDETDCAERKCSASDRPKGLWYCVCLGQSVDSSRVIFLTQICFVIGLVSLCVLQLGLRKVNCEEKTAYFMILSICLTYLLPPLSSIKNE